METDASSSNGEVLGNEEPLSLIIPSDGKEADQASVLSNGGVHCSYSSEVTVQASVSCVNQKAPGPSDLGQSATEGPRQPILKEYPLKKDGSSLQIFQATMVADIEVVGVLCFQGRSILFPLSRIFYVSVFFSLSWKQRITK